MTISPKGFLRPAGFEDLALGAIFRTRHFTADQIAIKVEGPGNGEEWILRLGGIEDGRAIAPLYAEWEDLGAEIAYFVDASLVVRPAGALFTLEQAPFVPGNILVDANSEVGVFGIDGRIFDLSSGRIWPKRPTFAASYARWSINYLDGLREPPLFVSAAAREAGSRQGEVDWGAPVGGEAW